MNTLLAGIQYQPLELGWDNNGQSHPQFPNGPRVQASFSSEKTVPSHRDAECKAQHLKYTVTLSNINMHDPQTFFQEQTMHILNTH